MMYTFTEFTSGTGPGPKKPKKYRKNLLLSPIPLVNYVIVTQVLLQLKYDATSVKVLLYLKLLSWD